MDEESEETGNRIQINYGEFYDVPRQIRFWFKDKWYFMDSAFDEAIDAYPDFYDVFLLPIHSLDEIKAKPFYWTELTNDDFVGRISISEVGLDESKRKSIDGKAFAKWLEAQENK